MLIQYLFQCGGVVVGDSDETRGHGAIVGIALGVVAHSDDGDGTAVEVAFAAYNHYLFVLNAFLDNTPAAGKLQGCFVGFCTAIHGQHLVVAEVLGDVFLPFAKAVVVECAAAEGQFLSLVAEGFDDFWMAVSLVHSRVGGKKVEIAFAFAVPYKCALTFGKNNGQRMIVVSTIAGFQFHEFFRFRHNVDVLIFFIVLFAFVAAGKRNPV